jgi:sporulation protein YlmC with PRC-barrel domain
MQQEEISMKHTLTFGALSLAAALAAGPAMAQSSNHATSTAPATGYPGNTANTAPSDRNPVMTQSGEARASKVVGSSVYNDRDQKVGSIDDLVIDKEGRISAILSVGGFLGMGSKYVEVPYSNLTFGNTQRDSDNRVVLKGATKESLQSTPGYNYYKS